MEQRKDEQRLRDQHNDKSAGNKSMPKQPDRNSPDRQGDPDDREAPRVDPDKSSGQHHSPDADRDKERSRLDQIGKTHDHERVFNRPDKNIDSDRSNR